jgi:hypothetical protein
MCVAGGVNAHVRLDNFRHALERAQTAAPGLACCRQALDGNDRSAKCSDAPVDCSFALRLRRLQLSMRPTAPIGSELLVAHGLVAVVPTSAAISQQLVRRVVSRGTGCTCGEWCSSCDGGVVCAWRTGLGQVESSLGGGWLLVWAGCCGRGGCRLCCGLCCGLCCYGLVQAALVQTRWALQAQLHLQDLRRKCVQAHLCLPSRSGEAAKWTKPSACAAAGWLTWVQRGVSEVPGAVGPEQSRPER